jgi:predicted proteasome-type protease
MFIYLLLSDVKMDFLGGYDSSSSNGNVDYSLTVSNSDDSYTRGDIRSAYWKKLVLPWSLASGLIGAVVNYVMTSDDQWLSKSWMDQQASFLTGGIIADSNVFSFALFFLLTLGLFALSSKRAQDKIADDLDDEGRLID